MTITAGGVYVLTGVHANGNVTVSGGSFAITTGDDAVTITDGTLDISKCYEGIEGQTIDISGGTIDIVSSGDGLNAAGGAGQSGFDGRGPDSSAATWARHCPFRAGAC